MRAHPAHMLASPPPNADLPTWLEDRLADAFWRGGPKRDERLERLLADHPAHADTLRARIADLRALDRSRGGATAAPDGNVIPLSSEVGRRIGPYHLIEVLGEGAFGVVYRAEQRVPVRRLVALKVLKSQDPRVLARFRQELEALEAMTHDNVARVLDAGDVEGRPFIALELVEGGRTLTAHAAETRLGLRERIELFRRVCDGVQHAHQRAVIHRDLKPGNVLVSVEGTPKIIDFGVARALSERDATGGLLTREGAPVGTPAYMSPEQARGSRDIDARTDVYSLGVILYELLTGVRPFDARFATAESDTEFAEIVQNDDPPRPSTVAGRAAVDHHAGSDGRLPAIRDLPPELDWIVLKAMAKHRDERYDSPRDLAEDLRRHLRHEPVLAGPPSTAYRVRKFVRRYRLEVAAAAIIVVVLVAATAVSFAYAIRARQKAEESDRLASSLIGLAETSLFDVHEAIADRIGSSDVRQLIAETASSYLSEMAAWRGTDPRVERLLAKTRLIESFAEEATERGVALELLGQFVDAAARPDLEPGGILGPDSPLFPALLRLSLAELDAGEVATGREHAERLLAVTDGLAGHPDDDVRAWLGVALLIAARFDQEDGLDHDAIEKLERGLAVLDEDTDSRHAAETRCSMLDVLAKIQAGLGMHFEAMANVDRAIAEGAALAADLGPGHQPRLILARTLVSGAETRSAFGIDKQCLEWIEQATALAEQCVAEDPTSAACRGVLELCLLAKASAAADVDEPSRALEPLHAAIASLDELMLDDPGVVRYHLRACSALTRLGSVQIDCGRADEALHSFRRARKIASKAREVFANSPACARASLSLEVYLADALRETGRGDEAKQVMDRLLASPEWSEVDLQIPELVRAAFVLRDLGDRPAALATIVRARRMADQRAARAPEAARPADELALVLALEGEELAATGDFDGAEKAFDAAIEIRERLRREHPTNLRSTRTFVILLNKYARTELMRGGMVQAEQLLARAMPLADEVIAAAPEIAWSLEPLADSLALSLAIARSRRETDRAVELAERCASLREKAGAQKADPVAGAAAAANALQSLLRVYGAERDVRASAATALRILAVVERATDAGVTGRPAHLDHLLDALKAAAGPLLSTKDFASAVRALELQQKVWSMRSRIDPTAEDPHLRRSAVWNGIAKMRHAELGDLDGAIEAARRALAILDEAEEWVGSSPVASSQRAATLGRLVELYIDSGDPDRALAAADERLLAATRATELDGSSETRWSRAWRDRGADLIRLGRPGDAVRELEEELANHHFPVARGATDNLLKVELTLVDALRATAEVTQTEDALEDLRDHERRVLRRTLDHIEASENPDRYVRERVDLERRLSELTPPPNR